jgi:Tol biopolymer transport system component
VNANANQTRISRSIGGFIPWVICFSIFLSPLVLCADDIGTYEGKNGYFTIAPPKGWRKKDFPTDPRSKVHFNCPPPNTASIGIIARPEEMTFDELIAGKRKIQEDFKRQFPTGKIVLSETTLCGFRTVKIEIEIPNTVKQELFFFLANGLHFNLTYSAGSQQDFAKFRKIALNSLSSIKPRGENSTATAKEVEEGELASSIRQAQIIFNRMGVGEGLKAIKELSKQAPNNKRVNDLKMAIEAISNTPIVFVSRRDGAQEIYSAKVDDSSLKRLTHTGAQEDHPAFSPDGRSIVFRSERSDNQDIWKMNYDGTNPVKLTDNLDKDSEPSWSPDHTSIIYASKRTGSWSLWSMKPDGTDKKKIIDNAGGGSISPDGRTLLFSRRTIGMPQIWRANSDGSNAIKLTSGPSLNISPAWSPDGKHIAFVSNRDGGGFAVYLMDSDGKNQKKLTEGPGNNGGRISFSPDGRWITFSSDRDGRMQIYLMSLDGTMETKICPSGSNSLTAYLGSHLWKTEVIMK